MSHVSNHLHVLLRVTMDILIGSQKLPTLFHKYYVLSGFVTYLLFYNGIMSLFDIRYNIRGYKHFCCRV